MNTNTGGRFCLAAIMLVLGSSVPAAGQTQKRYDAPNNGVTEFLPFATYDTDAGFGLGVKVFALNHLGSLESFDATVFWSTKGERWVRFVFSVMDFELRQGTVYPLAFDLVVDYDKWIGYKFFGVGNSSSYDALETYTREPLEISAALSRGFTRNLVGTVGLRYRTIENAGFPPGGMLASLPPATNQGRATSLGLTLSLRYDSRNSYIQPSMGLVLLGEAEFAPNSFAGNAGYQRYLGTISWYQMIAPIKTILAVRSYVEAVNGSDLPVQMMMGVGGNRTLRGYVQDRFIDRVAAVGNLELRFPLFWRIGGIAGIDAGKVWHGVEKMDFTRWPVNPVVGLRLTMDTFVVRGDVGFGKETIGIYLNFGHLF